MKISYVLQLKDFLIMFSLGLVLGVIYGLLNNVINLNRRFILQIVIDIIFSILVFTSIIFLINLVNMGEFRMFLVLGILFGFVLERLTLGKIFAKLFKKMYNYLVKALKNFANTKLGRIILK